MEFISTPDEAQTIAEIVAGHYQKKKHKIEVEKSLKDAIYCTTLLCSKNKLSILIEAQAEPSLDQSLRNFALWLSASRVNSEFYIATSESESVSGAFLTEIKKLGVGLIFVNKDTKTIIVNVNARNPALMVTLDPQIGLGSYKKSVTEHLETFNSGDRKTGLRELCEIVEGLTRTLTIKSASKGKMLPKYTVAHVDTLDWSNQIDVLASANQHNPGVAPTIDIPTKNDLHAFRDSRNLVNHTPRSIKDRVKREKQMPDKMLLGIRLISELQRKISSLK